MSGIEEGLIGADEVRLTSIAAGGDRVKQQGGVGCIPYSTAEEIGLELVDDSWTSAKRCWHRIATLSWRRPGSTGPRCKPAETSAISGSCGGVIEAARRGGQAVSARCYSVFEGVTEVLPDVPPISDLESYWLPAGHTSGVGLSPNPAGAPNGSGSDRLDQERGPLSGRTPRQPGSHSDRACAISRPPEHVGDESSSPKFAPDWLFC